MKFSINQSELSHALSTVSKGASNRSTLAILAGIYLKAEDNQIVLQSTNLELSIKIIISALVELPGETVVPSKLFLDVVKALPDMALSIELENNDLIVSCDNTTFSLHTLNPQDFPEFPEIKTEQQASFSFPLFSSMVKSVAKVVSKDETRAILTGVLISQEADTLKMVATDSYRLGVVESKLTTPSEPFEAVISGSFLQDITALPYSEDPLSLAFNENQIIVNYQNITFINRRIEGSFPNYRQLIREDYSTRVKISTQLLQEAVRRVSLLSNRVSPIKIHVDVEAQTIQLSTSSQDIGTAKETLFCEIEGESVDIAFNYNFVLDGLSVIKSSEIYLHLFGEMKPGIFKTIEGEDFLYLIMPVRI